MWKRALRAPRASHRVQVKSHSRIPKSSPKAASSGNPSPINASKFGAAGGAKSTAKPLTKLTDSSAKTQSANSSISQPSKAGSSSKPITRLRLSGGPTAQNKTGGDTISHPKLTPHQQSATQRQVNVPVALKPDLDEQRVLGLLSQMFGHSAFRSNVQRNATYALLNGLKILLFNFFDILC